MKLPRSVQEIAEVVGEEKALLLIGNLPRCFVKDPRYKGAQSAHVILYVPTAQRLKPDHLLVKTLGWNDAAKLCRAFGGEILQPGSCMEIYRQFRNQSIVRMLNAGMASGEVAELMGITVEQVRRVRRENPQEEQRAANDDNAPISTPMRRKNEKKSRKRA